MKQLVPFEQTRIGKRVQPLLPEQQESDHYQLEPQVAAIALQKNSEVCFPVVLGGLVGLGSMLTVGNAYMSIPGNPYNLGSSAAGPTDLGVGILVLASGIAPAVASLPFSYGLRNRVRAPNRRLADRLKMRIYSWAKKRYGVAIDENSLDDSLLRFLSVKQVAGNYHHVSARGRKFKLVASERGYYLEQYHEGTGEHVPAGSIAASEHIAGTDISGLTGEAHALAWQMQQQLEILEPLDLSAEGQHILQRVQQDFRQAISLNQHLLHFGPLASEESRLLADTLGSLSGELASILTQERTAAVKQLRVQRDYALGRQQLLGGERLALTKADSPRVEARELVQQAEDLIAAEAVASSNVEEER